jgi:hypothetical protein
MRRNALGFFYGFDGPEAPLGQHVFYVFPLSGMNRLVGLRCRVHAFCEQFGKVADMSLLRSGEFHWLSSVE